MLLLYRLGTKHLNCFSHVHFWTTWITRDFNSDLRISRQVNKVDFFQFYFLVNWWLRCRLFYFSDHSTHFHSLVAQAFQGRGGPEFMKSFFGGGGFNHIQGLCLLWRSTESGGLDHCFFFFNFYWKRWKHNWNCEEGAFCWRISMCIIHILHIFYNVN